MTGRRKDGVILVVVISDVTSSVSLRGPFLLDTSSGSRPFLSTSTSVVHSGVGQVLY